MGKFCDLTGKSFNRLTVIEISHKIKSEYFYKCRCVCGAEVVVSGGAMRSGNTKSCGCFNADRIRKSDGLSRTGFYQSWHDMKGRVLNQDHKMYQYYGGRGIKIDPAWVNFMAFMADMREGHKDGYTLERIDVNGPYCKKNCTWIPKSEQTGNRRNSIHVV